jgi:beta-N-acetylhexosaminidase
VYFCAFNLQMPQIRNLLFLLSFAVTWQAPVMAGPFSAADSLSSPRSHWVDSVYLSLDTNQRIAQLLIVRAFSTKDQRYSDSLTAVILGSDVGGVCFFKGTPRAQALLTNRWQDSIRTPLLVAIDAEWGMGMRLDSAFVFPYPITLGAVADDSLVYRVGVQTGKDCKRLGIDIDFAPVVDINNNPENPVINIRSFGENREQVAARGILFMNGLQGQGVIATAKHFPGHGDTDTDSHLALPLIRHPMERLDSVELYPFKQLIGHGVRAIMIAHLFLPALDTTANLPATLSFPVVTGLLKTRLGFKGFVITDALDMQGVTRSFPPGKIEVKALQAGNDILLLPKDVSAAIREIRAAIDSGLIDSTLLERKCKAILGLKYDMGLSKRRNVSADHIYQDLNPRSSVVLNDSIFRASITLLKNKNRLIPLQFLDKRKIAAVSVGDSLETQFQRSLSIYAPIDQFNVPSVYSQAQRDSLMALLRGYDLVILGLHVSRLYPQDHFGISKSDLAFTDSITFQNRTMLALFGNPYVLGVLRDPDAFEAVLTTYQDKPEAEAIAAEVLFGGTGAMGHLPVTTSGFAAGAGILTDPDRLGIVLPEEAGFPVESLRIIDSLAQSGITAGAYPGCQVLFARDGKVFYYRAFGHPTYHDTAQVALTDLYDLASVTKAAATTLAIMKLAGEGKISPDARLSEYLPQLKGSNKESLTIREVMTHQAGLQAWIPFYTATLKNGKPDSAIYSQTPSPEYPVRVSTDLHIKEAYRDTIINQIVRSPLGNRGEYKYSDLGFYLLALLVERVTQQSFGEYLNDQFYRPLGLTTMGFNPLDRFPESQIMPTEFDTTFRKEQIRGTVHDPGAAMLGGVSGHAGLFSDAFDLAVIFQMLLNHGEYGGKQYLMPSTIHEFTKAQYPGSANRRGLGFDKPPAVYLPDGPVCRSASPSGFGHSGFTGTYIWADPDTRLVYVFLSNRVFPDASNTKLAGMNIRTNIHQAMFDLLERYRVK